MLVAARTFEGVPFTIDIPSFREVGSGGTAKVFRGHVVHNYDSFAVAVKVFKSMLSETEQMLLHRELDIARKVSMRHHLIIAFLGTATIGLETSIVSLYMKNGNLLDYLQANDDADRQELLIQVAKAVDYLHTVEGLVHGDLKCGNVLISDFGEALLADFGLSTFVEKAESSATTATDARAKYTLRFAAPELLRDTAGVPPRRRSKTCETDVYAFGMLVLEALTEQSPWSGLNDLAVIKLVDSGAMPSRPMDGQLVSFSHAWWDICKACWSHYFRRRPIMHSVLDELRLHSLLPDRDIEPPGGGHSISTFTFMPCGQRIAVGTWTRDKRELDYPTTIVVYNISSGQMVFEPMVRLSQVYDRLAVSPDGRTIFATSHSELTRWDATSGVLCDQPVRYKGDIWTSRALSLDAKCVTSLTDGGRIICFWDTTTAERVAEPLFGHTDYVDKVVFSPTGTHVVTLSNNGEFFLWQFPTGKLVAVAPPVPDQSCVCFFPNGEHVVTGSEDGIIRIWSASSLQLERTLNIPTPEGSEHESQFISAVVVSPSSKYIASASQDMISIWETETGRRFGRPLECDMEFFKGMEFSPDGKTLVALCMEMDVIRVWDLFR